MVYRHFSVCPAVGDEDVSNTPARPERYVHASVGGYFTSEAYDITITTDNLRGQAQTITPAANATRVGRSLTISLGRALETGESVRAPLYIEAVPDAENREAVNPSAP